MKSKTRLYWNITCTNIAILFVVVWIHHYLSNAGLILPLGMLCIVLNSIRYRWNVQWMHGFDWIIKYRYPIALVVFIICVICHIHGSAIGCYDMILPDQTKQSIVFGVARPIRGDEFNVQTPYYFSQYYNHYKEISHYMSIAGQDMIIGYNAPVLDLTLIGKPFTWGYLLFGNTIGLSWYWCMKVILFLLMAYELLNILIRNSYYSFFGALLIVFSPSMQWWFCPHMYDVFFWATTLFVVGYYYFTSQKNWQKIGFTLLAICVLTGFVLALFPSCQIPTGLLMLALLIVCLYRDRQEWSFDKSDVIRILCVLGGLVLVLGHFIWNAQDQIKLLYNTVYPGKRISTGGNYQLYDLFSDFRTLFTPYRDPSMSNSPELSTFNHLGPFCMIYFPYLWSRMNQSQDTEDKPVGMTLFVVVCIEIFFMLIGFSETFAKITLFSYINRMKIVYGFTATIFTIWTMYTVYQNRKYLDKKVNVVYLIVFTGMILFVTKSMIDPVLMQHTMVYYGIALGFVGLGAFLIFSYEQVLITAFLVLISITSMTVNPIVHGTASIYNHEYSQFIQSVISKEDSYWLVADSAYLQNFTMANGAKVLNAVNFYPDYGKWKKIDPKLKNDTYYNRYIHMNITLTTDKTKFQLITPDSIQIQLNVNDLKKWHIKYLVTNEDVSTLLAQTDIQSKSLYQIIGGENVYQLLY